MQKPDGLRRHPPGRTAAAAVRPQARRADRHRPRHGTAPQPARHPSASSNSAPPARTPCAAPGAASKANAFTPSCAAKWRPRHPTQRVQRRPFARARARTARPRIPRWPCSTACCTRPRCGCATTATCAGGLGLHLQLPANATPATPAGSTRRASRRTPTPSSSTRCWPNCGSAARPIPPPSSRSASPCSNLAEHSQITRDLFDPDDQHETPQQRARPDQPALRPQHPVFRRRPQRPRRRAHAHRLQPRPRIAGGK